MHHTLMLTQMANMVSNMGSVTQYGSLDCIQKPRGDALPRPKGSQTHRVSSSDMLLRLWLDNVLIWLLLKSL